jgi:aarF domain-containing kinase
MFDNVRRARRSLRVARTGASIYLGYKRLQRKSAKADDETSARLWAAQHERNAARIYQTAVDLKGLYVKMGQFAGTRTDVFPAAYTRELAKLQDSVPPRAIGTVRKTIERAFHRPVAETFASFEETPVAAASLAQVHRARLHDGRDVAVKVQHPEVEGLVKLDIRNLRTLVGIVARREPNFDYRAIVQELASQVPLELDFEREGRMTTKVAENLAALDGVVLPRVIDGFVSRKVLVLEFLEGEKLLDGARAFPQEERAALAERVTAAYGHQILVDGLFQADPHPGNLMLLPGKRIGLLDFGLTKELPDTARLGFARLVVATATRDLPNVGQALRELGVKTKTDDPASVMELLSFFFGPRDMGPGLMGQRRAALAQNPVEALPGDLILLGRVVGLLRGVSASLGAPLTPMQMLRPHAERVLSGAK